MNDLNLNTSKTNYKSANTLKKNIKILKYFNNNEDDKNIDSFFSQFYKRKNNNFLISNLLNSSKKLVKDNSSYKSYTDLPKSFRYNYPYKPTRIKHNISGNTSSNSKKMIIYPYMDLNNSNKTIKINSSKKNLPKESKFKLHLKNFSFANNSVNEAIFFDFIDGYNVNSNIKEKYNNYILSHPIENDNDTNIFQLFNMLQNFKFDYNDNNFINDKSASKVNKFKLKNNLSIKIKITSLYLIFNKVKQKSKYHLFNKKNLLDSSNINNSKQKTKNIPINTKLKFPFGFLPFFYGLNNIDFLKFLITIIDYDYSKNIFYIDNKKLMKNYKIYKKITTFYGENSYFQKNYNKNKEFFMYDWDVINKNKMKTIHYIMKIVLPQIKISICFENKTISKFFYSIGINKIFFLIKEKFKLWDFHILKFFSEFKIFRQEVNRIICDKLSYEIKSDKFNESNNCINCNSNDNTKKICFKKRFNFNKMNTKTNGLLQNENSFEFFLSRNNNDKNEGYFFQMQIPKIHINYQFQNFFIDKYFDLDIKRMSQINKLRKSFQIEDLIKYSMVIVDQKFQIPKKRKSSIFESNGCRRSIKRASTFKNHSSSQKLNIKKVSTRVSVNNSNFLGNKMSLKGNKNQSSLRYLNNENTKDITLNLDKYIFNFDDDILKFIKPFEEEKNNNIINGDTIKSDYAQKKRRMNRDNSIISNRSVIQMNKKKFNVEIGKIKLVWNTHDLKENEYYFEEKESEYLLDNPINVWENYIENKLDEFKS